MGRGGLQGPLAARLADLSLPLRKMNRADGQQNDQCENHEPFIDDTSVLACILAYILTHFGQGIVQNEKRNL